MRSKQLRKKDLLVEDRLDPEVLSNKAHRTVVAAMTEKEVALQARPAELVQDNNLLERSDSSWGPVAQDQTSLGCVNRRPGSSLSNLRVDKPHNQGKPWAEVHSTHLRKGVFGVQRALSRYKRSIRAIAMKQTHRR